MKPKNYYAKTKSQSEKIIFQTLKKTKTIFTVFRFFTVYGPYGRPDMFIHKFLNSINNNKIIRIHNRGLNFRDFTFVDDVVRILKISTKKDFNRQIINICRSKPIRTDKLIKIILRYFKNKKVKIKMVNFVKGEMLKTHGCNKKLKKNIRNFKFTDLNLS